jgi:hypothetical protein
MGIPLIDQSDTPAGDIVRRQLPITSVYDFLSSLRLALLDAGWSHDQEGDVSPNATLTFTGVPANNQTVTINGRTYTYKTTLTGAPDEVKIIASAAACAINLVDAVNDNEWNEGITYGAGTTPNADCSAELVGASAVTLTGHSVEDTGKPVSETLNNASFNWSYLGGSQRRLSSAVTPQGLQFAVSLEDGRTGSYILIRPQSVDGSIKCSIQSDTNCDTWAATLQYAPEVLATKFWFLIFYPTIVVGPGCGICGTLYLPEWQAPGQIQNAVKDSEQAISGATNASPVEVSITDHGFSTGEQVVISGVEGNTAANGTWYITVTGPGTFTLNGSSGNGNYSGGGSAIRSAAVFITQTGHGYSTGNQVYIDRSSSGGMTLNGSWVIEVIDLDSYRLRNSQSVQGSYDPDNPSIVAGPGQASQSFFMAWDNWGQNGGISGGNGHWRNASVGPFPLNDTRGGFRERGDGWVCYNGYAYFDNPDFDLQYYGVGSSLTRQWFGGRHWLADALLAWSVQGYNGTDPPEAVGWMFNTALAYVSLPLDSEMVDADGKKWKAYTNDAGTKNLALLYRIPDGYN